MSRLRRVLATGAAVVAVAVGYAVAGEPNAAQQTPPPESTSSEGGLFLGGYGYHVDGPP